MIKCHERFYCHSEEAVPKYLNNVHAVCIKTANQKIEQNFKLEQSELFRGGILCRLK